MLETGRIFLPNGVCMYKYAHEQSCTTFCTLRQGFLPSFGLFPAWLWAVPGAGYTESCERFYAHLCHLLGAVAVMMALGLQVLMTGLLSAYFL